MGRVAMSNPPPPGMTPRAASLMGGLSDGPHFDKDHGLTCAWMKLTGSVGSLTLMVSIRVKQVSFVIFCFVLISTFSLFLNCLFIGKWFLYLCL